MKNGRIIGWKLQDREISAAQLKDATRIAYDFSYDLGPKPYSDDPKELRKRFEFNEYGEHPFSFAINSTCEKNLIKSCLLHEIFEPVYESCLKKLTGTKIIGYKLPVTIHEKIYEPEGFPKLAHLSSIPEGHLFVHYKALPNFYVPSDTISPEKYSIPKEIVETWEPVYEKEYEEIVAGECRTVFKIYKGKILVDNDNEISHDEIDKLLTAIIGFPKNISGSKNNYKIEFDNIHIGCSYFTRREIFKIADAYKRFNGFNK